MTFNNEDLPGVRPYFQWNGTIWEEATIQNVRMVVYGSLAPALQIDKNASDAIVLRWPGSVTNFVLEVCEKLSATNDWVRVTNAPSIKDGQWVVTNRTDKGSEFFRLNKE
jgi:hypothetical protein